MTVTMTHNPKCETSRNVLAILRERGIEPSIIEYLKTPLTREQIAALAQAAGVPVRDLVRWKQKSEAAAAGISETSDDVVLLEAMVRAPVLLNRPIVTTPKGTRLCRPSETVMALL